MLSKHKPTVFIGSSTEQLNIARAVNAALDHDAHCNVWTYGFDPSKFTLESLEDEIRKSDFAVFVVVPDDITISRNKKIASPRDNVILELGMAIGALTRHRTIILTERGVHSKIPTDLLGLTPLTFERRNPLSAAVEPACNAIRERMADIGMLPRIFGTGNIISYNERSLMSTGFAASTLRILSVFGGDLSWLEEDLSIYKSLKTPKRNVVIRILTDTPGISIIKKAKKIGVEFRQYPDNAQAPIKASLSDTDSEADARALVVRRHIPISVSNDAAPYQYWMKIYRGTNEYPVIKSMSLLFDFLWAKALKL